MLKKSIARSSSQLVYIVCVYAALHLMARKANKQSNGTDIFMCSPLSLCVMEKPPIPKISPSTSDEMNF